jgi:serine protease Do
LTGINTLILSAGGGSEGLDFAIPEPSVRFVFNELREHGWVRQTSMGPNPQTITPTLAAGLRLPEDWGAIISDVSISADLAAGDVIRSFNGQSFSTVGELRTNLKKLKPGDAAVLEVERQAVVRFVAFEMK